GPAARRRIDPFVGRKLAAPMRAVPASAGDPDLLRQILRERLDARSELLARARVAELHGVELDTCVDEMQVRIDEPGDDQPAACIERPLRPTGRLDLGI